MTDRQAKVLAAYVKYGTHHDAAAALKMSVWTFRDHLKAVRAELPPTRGQADRKWRRRQVNGEGATPADALVSLTAKVRAIRIRESPEEMGGVE